MKTSILRNILLSFLGFGLLVAGIFPFYANLFVQWKPGMLPWFVAGCVVAGLMIGLANYWLLNTILLRKLRRISEVANAISNKDLSYTCTVRSADTIGEIVTSFNNMTRNLRELIGETAALSGSVRQDSGSIHDFMAGIAENLNEQTRQAGEISASIDHLAETVGRIAAGSEKAAERAQQAADQARQGGEIVRNTIQGMDKISQTVADAARVVEELGRDSDRIGAIIAVIREIADQTNLLALNAAIEAARAGEQGRGFAVVADEVRKLAEKTGGATAEIGDMIASIQRQTAEAVRTMEAGTAEVSQGVERSREAGASLEEIMESANRVTAMIRDIARATTLQNEDVQQVRRNIAEIGTLIEHTLQNTREGKDRTEHLAELAGSLHNAVTAFRLK
jgi:methyl-accepting chemotaxis protein